MVCCDANAVSEISKSQSCCLESCVSRLELCVQDISEEVSQRLDAAELMLMDGLNIPQRLNLMVKDLQAQTQRLTERLLEARESAFTQGHCRPPDRLADLPFVAQPLAPEKEVTRRSPRRSSEPWPCVSDDYQKMKRRLTPLPAKSLHVALPSASAKMLTESEVCAGLGYQGACQPDDMRCAVGPPPDCERPDAERPSGYMRHLNYDAVANAVVADAVAEAIGNEQLLVSAAESSSSREDGVEFAVTCDAASSTCSATSSAVVALNSFTASAEELNAADLITASWRGRRGAKTGGSTGVQAFHAKREQDRQAKAVEMLNVHAVDMLQVAEAELETAIRKAAAHPENIENVHKSAVAMGKVEALRRGQSVRHQKTLENLKEQLQRKMAGADSSEEHVLLRVASPREKVDEERQAHEVSMDELEFEMHEGENTLSEEDLNIRRRAVMAAPVDREVEARAREFKQKEAQERAAELEREKQKQADLRESLLLLAAEHGTLALLTAADRGESELFMEVLRVACVDSVNCIDHLGRSVLHGLAKHGFVEAAEALLEDGRFDEINRQHSEGWTALHVPARCGHPGFCQLLLGNPAFKQSNATDANGRTALHSAAVRGDVNIVQCILKCPAFNSINATNTGGYTALHIAERYGHEAVCNTIHAYLEEKVAAAAESEAPKKRNSVKFRRSARLAMTSKTIQQTQTGRLPQIVEVPPPSQDSSKQQRAHQTPRV